MKMWTFYCNGEVSGVTQDKRLAKQYKLERPHCKCIVENMNEYQASSHLYFNQGKVLFENVMDDGKETITPITSYEENDLLDNHLSKLHYEMESLIHEIEEYPIQKKYKKLLIDALNYLDEEGNFRLNITRIYLRYIANYDIK